MLSFSERTLELDLNLVNVSGPRLIWTGITTRKLGLVEPLGSLDVTLDIVPHDTGLQVRGTEWNFGERIRPGPITGPWSTQYIWRYYFFSLLQ